MTFSWNTLNQPAYCQCHSLLVLMKNVTDDLRAMGCRNLQIAVYVTPAAVAIIQPPSWYFIRADGRSTEEPKLGYAGAEAETFCGNSTGPPQIVCK